MNDLDMHDGMSGGYPRSHFNSSLPPSGPTAAAHHSVWYDTRRTAPPGSEGVGADVKQDENTELTSTSTGGETSLGLGTSSGDGTGTNSLSPLASLGTLQNALPDVAGNGTQE
jgi:hypothetical protein